MRRRGEDPEQEGIWLVGLLILSAVDAPMWMQIIVGILGAIDGVSVILGMILAHYERKEL